MRLIPDLLSYVKAAFVESHQVIFTLFDVLGIILFLVPQLAEYFGRNELDARVLGGILFFLFFVFVKVKGAHPGQIC